MSKRIYPGITGNLFSEIFDSTTLYLTAAGFTLFVPILWAVLVMSEDEEERKKYSLADVWFSSVSAAFNHGCPNEFFGSKKTKFLISSYQITSFLLATCYSGLILSKLVNPQIIKNIDSLEDVMKVPNLKVTKKRIEFRFMAINPDSSYNLIPL